MPEQHTLILDGLPRSYAQAERLDCILDVIQIFHLKIVDTVMATERLRARALRENRLDDMSDDVIHRRLQTYYDETFKTLSFYPERADLTTSTPAGARSTCSATSSTGSPPSTKSPETRPTTRRSHDPFETDGAIEDMSAPVHSVAESPRDAGELGKTAFQPYIPDSGRAARADVFGGGPGLDPGDRLRRLLAVPVPQGGDDGIGVDPGGRAGDHDLPGAVDAPSASGGRRSWKTTSSRRPARRASRSPSASGRRCRP